MTRCEFFTEADRITGFSISGHSGYAEAGSDIVCAAITAVVTMAEATINDVCGAKAKIRVKDADARITLTLPASCDEEESVQAVLAGMLLTLCSLRDDYPDYIEVLEV
ncbi:MAG: ribosomal-processing cysteine protease Prp [Candidatus Faecousia sp.]|nr:ribosomal-processing cysteine protease Prp [Bacillota bacterium]MDY4221889.1 ribosomal-processing cysteine protease Prp [Candidatus Faecousia sp.]MDY4755066.1 ribosomal-processing cysteine protease Prp [Candidatus Faecousia sp.]MDY6159899.1 ribosomal-processing cysteine protease Prp [Candidatus Faecousia sp.]